MNINIQQWLPFLRWYRELSYWPNLRADIIAGITVAMFLIPQSLAYAQIAGLPAYYGLYAAFIPPIIGALFGSSRSLSTGPVAITSLLTGFALQGLAASGSEIYLHYVLLLAIMAGLIQITFAVLRMGLVVNFISFPVLAGFTNAAVIIIAATQIPKLAGMQLSNEGPIYKAVFDALAEIPNLIHWPSLGMGLLAMLILFSCERWFKKIPSVLLAVLVTTIIAWSTHFEESKIIDIAQIINPSVQETMRNRLKFAQDNRELLARIDKAEQALKVATNKFGEDATTTIDAINKLSQVKLQLDHRMLRNKLDKEQLNKLRLRMVKQAHNEQYFFVEGKYSSMHASETLQWRIHKLQNNEVYLHAGGEVIGAIPQGLPAFTLVRPDWSVIQKLFMMALALALVGFMESIAVAKQIATESREYIDVNQELFGQGLAKVVGAFFQSMPVSGGFSRSVLNFYSGAKTGFASIVSGLSVMIVLLWLTPLFYYLPVSTLAAIIIYTVLKLLNLKSFVRIYRVNKEEGLIALITFAMTILFAPHIEIAVILGALMGMIVYLNDTMRPKFTELVRSENGELIEAKDNTSFDSYCYLISIVRVGGSLYFANASHVEEKILHLIAKRTRLQYIIIDCVSINMIDASGIEALIKISRHLEEAGIELWLSRVRYNVTIMLKKSSLASKLDAEHVFKTNEQALTRLSDYLGAKHVGQCPLLIKSDAE